MSDALYPPLDLPKPVAEGVWVVDSGPQRVLGLSLPIRMTVLRLADGGLWLHSPTRWTPDLGAALAELGPVRHLIAPTTAHWTHLQSWQSEHPEAVVWAAPTVAPRARRQRSPVKFHRALGDVPPLDWEAEIDQALFRGPGFAEVAFLHRASRTLVLADLVQNLEPERLPTATRLMARASGVAGPQGGIPRYILPMLLARRADNRASAERVIGWAPRRAIFAHGTWYAEDATPRLERAFRRLLPA